MTDLDSIIENVLRKHFYENITIFVKNEEYKRGEFILFHSTILSSNYYIEFHIKTNKKIDIIRVPFPFSVEYHPDEKIVYFDYRIKTLARGNIDIMKRLEEFSKHTEGFESNKFYNQIIEIQFK